MILEKTLTTPLNSDENPEQIEAAKQTAFANETFPVFELLDDPRNLPGVSEQEFTKKEIKIVEGERRLYRALERFLSILEPIQETFEKHGVPLIITRSIAIYIWVLSLHMGHLIPTDPNKEEVLGIEGDLLGDIDYLVPVEMWQEIDAALVELETAGKIRVRDKQESLEEVHDRGLKSYLFRQFVVLDENGNELVEVEIFGGLGGYIERDDNQLDYKTFQAVTVNEDREVLMLRNQGEELIASKNLDLRRIQIGSSQVRFLVGEGLRVSYDFEAEKILQREGRGLLSNKEILKERQLIWKLRLIEFFLGNDPMYQAQ